MSEPAYRESNPLQTPVRFVKGVGPRIAALLEAKGILSAEDLLYYLPTRYLDRRRLDAIGDLSAGKDHSISGEILACGISYAGRRRRIFEMAVSDGSGVIRLKWFRFQTKYFQGTFQKGMTVLASGRVTQYRGEWQMAHPSIQVLESEASALHEGPGIIPLYPVIPKLGQKYLRRIIGHAFDICAPYLTDPFPEDFRQLHGLISLGEALTRLHRPDDDADADLLASGTSVAHRRLIFDELFFLELGLALKRRRIVAEAGIRFEVPGDFQKECEAKLPFTLTAAQRRVTTHIYRDMRAPHPMNRLLQGDVGSGKTVVAALACRTALQCGYQVAVMAPTEILAEQHFKNLRQLMGSKDGEIGLLSSSIAPKERKWQQLRLREGRLSLVVGTHALLSEEVVFKRLGLVVIDEQHRFGVMQRKSLRAKACAEGVPDVLVMTATPIPRTLAMTLYGELDVSVIDELPPGRQSVETRIIGEKQRRQLYNVIRRVVERGEQVFIVYPLVEETEKSDLKAATEMADHLQKEVFPEFNVSLLHGRMSSDDKEATMKSFHSGESQILVTTTVVEVGIDIPNATCMVIEHPERFGLSQLHQLRGRIGRGQKASLCVLLASPRQNEVARRRLEVMEATTDGFKIAEEDLKIRGPGEFLGTRQSGLPDLKFANLVRDVPILAEAREAAITLLAGDPHLDEQPHFREIIRNRWQAKLELSEIG